ncbi:MucBP domain-containing protein [Listeria monocytogenes]|uniref:MucBP domain-containing protein n=1 Tax=Listeria monocytogenes TaxID=1639 RepID=UPI000874CB4B|nr:MucBP domain-containing protein [Listeria monocytogenes]EAC4145465.1 cell surface protein [Listeria monocytogenes]EAC5257154.1 cell surface protein [Listeria monocytogenes]EAC6418928.1 cell surface protein [Listeria monocytogenes]EAD7176561.1 cell surface protein [Listeria monocytogenes]EAE9061467.1 cell surface protein [Listeria monocytogenes]
MKKKYILCLFAVMLFCTGFLFGNSQVDAAETDTSNVTYKYIDISTLTETQKNSIIKGKPNETLTNDYENYSFVYQKNTSGPTTNTDNTSDNNKDQNGTLLKAGDVGPNIYLVILGFILLGSGIGLLTLKKRHAKQLLVFLLVLGGSSLLVGSIVQATENSNLKTQESQTVVKGTKETKQPESIAGYTYVGYIHTSKNNTAPPVEKGIVTVNYQDEQGNSVAATETLEGDIGKPYQTSMKNIEDYTWKEVKGEATGTFTEKAQVVTYVYQKVSVATVTVRYLDQDGKPIHEPQTISGNVGEPYDASTDKYKLQIDGYVLDTTKLPNNANGTFTNQATQVTYIYTKEAQDVTITIKFVDNNGNPFVLTDLTTYKNGDLVPVYPNLDQYHMRLNYNQQIYSQGEAVSDIVLSAKEGETYSLPERMTFNIIDDKGNEIPYVISQNPDFSSSGIEKWENYRSIPANHEGTLTGENVVVTYQIFVYGVMIPAP